MKGRFVLLPALAATFVVAGCGGAKHASKSPAATTASPTTQPAQTSTSPGALQAEAASAATGDIPDNQIYLLFHSKAGWSIKYPEGWAQSGSSSAAVFRDKNNIVRIVIHGGSPPTAADVRNDPSLQQARITSAPKRMTIGDSPVIKVVYSTQSAPNPVTGKRVTLMVDRYELAKKGRVAVIDLGTPTGVDNVDAYRMMSESFTWL